MKERPILFSGPMVRAILEGRKTHTRRVVKPQPDIPDGSYLKFYPRHGVFGRGPEEDEDGPLQPLIYNGKPLKCPYGKPGDRLWVRETFQTIGGYDAETQKTFQPINDCGIHGRAIYRADGGNGKAYLAWKPSIHMPRWASRILLEIIRVRVERLNEISDDDSKAEGIEPRGISLRTAKPSTWTDYLGRNGAGFVLPRESFKSLWESINGPTSWDKNPWVWVVEFKRVEAA